MTSVYAQEWKAIDTGLAYAQSNGVHLFRIDPKLFKFSVVTAKDLGESDATAPMFTKKAKAILAVNGGFFSPEHKSLGLLMREGKTINPLRTTSWWAIFQVSQSKPSIIPLNQFIPSANIEMALQVGPRLVVDGEVPKLKPSTARRSGIGICNGPASVGQVVIAVTETAELSMDDFADLFKKLGCANALNLDGGGSTQLTFNWKGFKIEVPGPSRVANAIVVTPRN